MSIDNFKTKLDAWITREPEDNLTPWIEQVMDYYSDEFYKNAYEDRKDFESCDLETKWFNKLFDRQEYEDYEDCDDFDQGITKIFGNITPEKAAKIIERVYNMYVKGKNPNNIEGLIKLKV